MLLSRNLFFVLCLLVSAGSCLAQEKAKKDGGKPAKPAAKSAKSDPKAAAKSDKGKDKKTGGEEKKPDGAEEKPVQKMSVPLPEGHDSHGIVIPYTDASGQKTMNFRIGVGRKIDTNTVKMSDLLIEMYDAEGRREMFVSLPSATLDLPTRIIKGDNTVTVKRDDFEITGKEMEFNTESRQGWIKGNVKMIIQDLTGEEDGPDKDAPPKPTPAASVPQKAEADPQ